ncbi:MAG: Rrf2 family transcriptional regulator [Verrucomicrobiota bacterium]
MLSLSQSTGYAIHALSCMKHDGVCLIQDISRRTGIQKPYLAKLVHKLSGLNLILSKRGRQGGIMLARPLDEITVLQVVEAVEGRAWMGQCLLGLHACNAQHICPSHKLWTKMKEQICKSLQKITLADVSAEKLRNQGNCMPDRCQASGRRRPSGRPTQTKDANQIFGDGDRPTDAKTVVQGARKPH